MTHKWYRGSDEPPFGLAEVTPQPDSEGWIEWRGGKCPVADGTLVDVRYRDGTQRCGIPANRLTPDPIDASCAFWRNDGSERDIVAYRFLKEIPVAQTLKEYALEQLNTNEGLSIPGKDNVETAAYIKSVVDVCWQGRPMECSVHDSDRWYPMTEKVPVSFAYRWRFKRDPVDRAMEDLKKLRDKLAKFHLDSIVSQVDSVIETLKGP